jgi:hypothetical protein
MRISANQVWAREYWYVDFKRKIIAYTITDIHVNINLPTLTIYCNGFPAMLRVQFAPLKQNT